MTQPITDYAAFLGEAKQAIENLERIKKNRNQLDSEEKQLKRQLEAEKKAVDDEVALTIKKRREEIANSYDKEITRGQERLKKTKAKREKAKNQGIKERIAEETFVLHNQNQELKMQIKTLFQKERLPSFCSGIWYYALYMPRTLKEFGIAALFILICFAALPWGVYRLIPFESRRTWMLMLIYLVDILLIGGLYLTISNRTKIEHTETIRQGRQIWNAIHANHKKIRSIARSIRKDRNEAIYNLEKYDDEIAKTEQELKELTTKKQDALNTFHSVTQTIISDEIISNNQTRIQELEESHERTESKLMEIEREIKVRSLEITDKYETYLGKEFIQPDKLSDLARIIRMGQASNISEAIAQYKSENI